ncbi:MAG: hypothetical protein GY786_19505 [Proteobacteria bacterium]|nr:hypothetical protein [Pseudomonadota bacterium]
MEQEKESKKKWITPTTLVVGMTLVLGLIMMSKNILQLINNMMNGIY